VNKAQLVDAVASKAGITKRAATMAVNVVLEEINRTPDKAPRVSRAKRSVGAPRETVRIKKTAPPKSVVAKKAPAKKAPAKKAPAKKAPAKKAPAKKAPAKKSSADKVAHFKPGKSFPR
jgi:DNA-binding protein HU-beta